MKYQTNTRSAGRIRFAPGEIVTPDMIGATESDIEQLVSIGALRPIGDGEGSLSESDDDSDGDAPKPKRTRK